MTNDWLDTWHWPDDLSAQRWLIVGEDALQIGAAAARRGAQVTALPLDEQQPLPRAEVVVCQQLFLRIRHPLWWLERVCASTLTAAILHFWSAKIAVDQAMLTFDEAQGWQGNRIALARLARSAGFAQIAVLSESSEQLCLKAMRQWQDLPLQAAPTMKIRQVINSVNGPVNGLNVFPRSGRYAFAALFVAGLPMDAQRWEVRISIGDFGVYPIRVTPVPDNHLMQVNVALPPGLPVGRATVQLWYRDNCAEPCEIEVVEGTQW